MYIFLLLLPQALAGNYVSVPASAPLYAANPYVRTIYVGQVPSAPFAQPLAQPMQYNQPSVIYTVPQTSPTTYASSGPAATYQQPNAFPSPSDGAGFIQPQYFKPNSRGYYKLRRGSPVYSGCREYLSDPCNCPPSCRPYVPQYSASSCGGFGGQQDRGYGGSRYGAGGGGGGAYGYGDSGPWENGWDVLDPQGGHYHHHHKHHQKAFNFEEEEDRDEHGLRGSTHDDEDDRITVKPRTHKTHHEEIPDEDLWGEDEHKSSNKEEIDSFMDSGETREFVKTRLGESGGHSQAPSPSFGSGGLGGGGSPGFGGGGGNPGGIGIGGGVNAAGVGVNTGLGISAPGIGTAGPVPGSGGGMGGGGLGGGLGNGGLFGISSGIGVGVPGVGPIGVSSGLGIGK